MLPFLPPLPSSAPSRRDFFSPFPLSIFFSIVSRPREKLFDRRSPLEKTEETLGCDLIYSIFSLFVSSHYRSNQDEGVKNGEKTYQFSREGEMRRNSIEFEIVGFSSLFPDRSINSAIQFVQLGKRRIDTGAGRGLRIRSWKNAGGQAVTTNWGACHRDKLDANPGHPLPDLGSRVHRRSPADPIYRPSPLRSLGAASNSGIICPPCVSSSSPSSPSVSPLIRITSPPLSTSLSSERGTDGRYDPSPRLLLVSRPPIDRLRFSSLRAAKSRRSPIIFRNSTVLSVDD